MVKLLLLFLVFIAFYGVGTSSVIDCKKEKGCYKGKCCKPCVGASAIFWWLKGDEWCYSTRSYSQSYQYVYCYFDDVCDPNWHCAGPCTID